MSAYSAELPVRSAARAMVASVSDAPASTSRPDTAPVPVDLLAEALSLIEPFIGDCTQTPKQRIEALWAGVYAARSLGSAAIVGAAFLDLAGKTGLVAALGAHGIEDARHVIWWGLRGRDPFDREPVR